MKFFAEEKTNDKESQEAIKRMIRQINKVGGRFTFDFVVDKDGWMATCREFDGIITGGTNKNPSEKEVMKSLIESIKTAFHIPIKKLEIKGDNKPLPTIIIAREFQLV